MNALRLLAAPALSAILIGGLLGTSQLHLTPADAGDYHARVKAAIEAVPYVVGDWVGEDVPVPAEATDLLKPNALLSRRYTHAGTGESVTLMLVHCKDARDLQGHYPPVCYPAAGWRLMGDPVDSRLQGMVGAADEEVELPARTYAFQRQTSGTSFQMLVSHLMLLPDNTTTLDMAGVDQTAGDHRLRHLGAAQVQVVYPLTTRERVSHPTPAGWQPLVQEIQTVRRAMASDMRRIETSR